MIKVMRGHVYHARTETAQNAFKYPIFNIYFSADATGVLQQAFRAKFKNLISFSARNYLDGSAQELQAKINQFVETQFSFKSGFDYDKVILQTIPKMFGYVFNPVSFWYFKKNNNLAAVLCEVNNTFGERHFYWLRQPDVEDLSDRWLQAEKQFHVSPFFDREGRYEFKFVQNSAHIESYIKYMTDTGELRLLTWIKGELTDLERHSLFSLLFSYGWMTPIVVLRIHFQAFKLWLKKVKFFSKPEPLQKGMTYGELKNDSQN